MNSAVGPRWAFDGAVWPELPVWNGMAVQLEERFQLQLSREEAVQYMQQLIDESVAAVFPQVTVSTAIALVAT